MRMPVQIYILCCTHSNYNFPSSETISNNCKMRNDLMEEIMNFVVAGGYIKKVDQMKCNTRDCLSHLSSKLF